MADSKLYRKIAEAESLSRAWHLAILDSRDDFIVDAWSHADYASNLRENLESISRRLRAHRYHPHPLLHVDIPKSTLAVRPGTILDIEDKIVLWSILAVAGGRLDARLPSNVYSYRVRKSASRDTFFDRREILDYPFLKRTTILEHVSEFEPWFYAWVEFTRRTFESLRKRGFSSLVKCDISAYFENIDLNVLRAQLSRAIPEDQDVAHLLVDILGSWTWPAYVGTPAPRGIPQGNDVSGFLGSFYLHPLDEAILRRGARSSEIFYARYVDDVVVLTQDRATAVEVILRITRELRNLRLTVQGAKTQVIDGITRIRDELVDPRLEKVNKVIWGIERSRISDSRARNAAASQLRKACQPLRKRKGFYIEKDQRLFRRIMTAYGIMGHPGLTRAVVGQLRRNADARFLGSAIRYFRSLRATTPKIAAKLLLLVGDPEMFPYQVASFFTMLKELGQDVTGMRREAMNRLRTDPDWFVRHEAGRLLGTLPLSPKEIAGIERRFVKETTPEVQRALFTCLVQSERRDLFRLSEFLLTHSEPELHRLGRFVRSAMTDEELGHRSLKQIFNNLDERKLAYRIHELEILSKSEHASVRSYLGRRLSQLRGRIRRPVLLQRVNRIRQALTAESRSGG